MRPSSASRAISTDTPIMMGTSWQMSWRLTTSGTMRALMPRMNSTLKMLLPTTLPTAMSALPASTADTDTPTSGALVPKATMVKPTTRGEMPNDRASLPAPRTSRLAPNTSAARPAANKKKLNMVIQTIESATLPKATSIARLCSGKTEECRDPFG